MFRFLKNIVVIGLIVVFVVSPATPVSAQSGLSIRVSQVSTIETPDAMTLKVYFNIFDPKTSLPVLDAIAKTAQLALPNTNFLVDAKVQKPDVPIYIVLILDASGSMGGAAEELKKAAKLSLNNTPDNSYFSVVQFDEQIKLIQDFTQNIPAVSYAIDQYQVSNKGTCLYDAAYSSAESLQKAPAGRRAIILFTDGRDENANGRVCSKHTFLELSDFAQKSQIPINTVGLAYKESNLNEVELKGLAASTGAFSAIAKQDDLGKAFQSIMDGLKAQWMVQANVYPKKGANEVVLSLNLKDDQTLSTSFPIQSNTEYSGPPSPVSAQLAGLQFVPEDQTYNVQLSMTSPELVDYVKIEIWDAKGGSKVAEFTFKDLQQDNTFNVPTGQLIVGRDYELRMSAISKTDQTRFPWATDGEGKKSQQLIHAFTFDPTANLPSLTIQSIAQQNNDLVLSIKTTNSQLIGGFDGWLLDENTNTQVPNSNFTSATLDSTSGIITIPLSKKNIPAGKYTVVVRVLGKNNQEYSVARYPGIVFQPEYPNILQLLGAALIAAPIILFLVVVIILGVVGFLMYSSMREKSLTGMPVLQGRLGGNLGVGGKPAGPVIPVADEEPILPPNRNAVAPARPAPAPVGNPMAAPNGVAPDRTLMAAGQTLPAPFLAILQAPAGAAQGGRIRLDAFPFDIGRTDGSFLVQEANVSRRHARITYDAPRQTYYVQDLNSSNGTSLNGQPLTAGQMVPIYHGAVIGLGPNILFRFELG